MPTRQPAPSETPIRVVIGETVLTGRLWDHATARDLLTPPPAEPDLPRRQRRREDRAPAGTLSMDSVPANDNPLPRDIGFYTPSGDGSVEAIVRVTSTVTARFERAT